MKMIKGIDISKYQINVNYKKLKSQGIEFAIIQCGFGKNATQKDKMFEKHYKGLKDAGIKVGCYLYSYCDNVNNAILEAKNCLEFIKGKTFELPVFYDLEDKITKKLGRVEITEIAKIFCEEIEKNGYKAGVYANLDWFKNYIDLSKINQYKIWLAQWTNNPTKDFHYDYWQYTDKGNVDGIVGYVDMNYCYDTSVTVENVDKIVDNRKTNEEIAKEVWAGKWSNGQERIDKLTQAGYDYNEIQKIVNQTNEIRVGSKVKVKHGSTDYVGHSLASFVYTNVYDVIQINGKRVVIGKGNTVTCAIDKNNLILQ